MAHVITIMIDGLGADYVQRHQANLPNLTRLAADGTIVRRLAADVPATSLPGRTSILTGVPASRHGIYGNLILDGQRFRYANPDDVRVPTVPAVAVAAGADVAVIGYGMVRPEDANVFHHAWWANEMIQRARDEAPIPADEGWLRTSRHVDETGRLAALADLGLPDGIPDAYAGGESHYFMSGVAADRTMMRWTAALATSDQCPDFSLTEILTPDSVQHVFGADHPFSHWSIGYADALVGTLVAELEAAGRLESTVLVVTSDHGHGPVERALYSDRLLPNRPASSEGCVLFVAVENERDASTCSAALAEHGVSRLPADVVPPDARNRLAVFVAPERTAFQRAPAIGHAAHDATAVGGPPNYRSMHGFRPGHPYDERFAIVRGPGVPSSDVAGAASEDVAATLSALLNLPVVGRGKPFI